MRRYKKLTKRRVKLKKEMKQKIIDGIIVLVMGTTAILAAMTFVYEIIGNQYANY